MEISVLMSICYKETKQYLMQSLESIINQTVKPKEIVIIKDGNILEEVETTLNRYQNKFSELIKIYELTNSEGLGRALKYGVEQCKCKYIARMDSDDIAPLYRIEEQIKILKKNPEIDLLGGYIEEYDENMEEKISIRKVPLTNEEIRKAVKVQSPFNHGTIIAKKETILNVGNYNNIGFEDYDLWARMIVNNCNMKNMDMILSMNRTGKPMYRRRSGIKYIKKIIQIENQLFKYKLINIFEYLYNVSVRTLVAISPTNFKKYLYRIIRKM